MSLKNKTRLYKWICYSLWFILFTALQTSVFNRFRLWGASPMLAPLFVAIVAMLECSTDSLVFGLCAGIITDALTGISGFYTFTLCAACPLLIYLVENIVAKSRLMVYILSGIFALAEHVLLALLLSLFSGGGSSLPAWQGTLPETVYTLLIGIPLLFILFAVDARFDRSARHRR